MYIIGEISESQIVPPVTLEHYPCALLKTAKVHPRLSQKMGPIFYKRVFNRSRFRSLLYKRNIIAVQCYACKPVTLKHVTMRIVALAPWQCGLVLNSGSI
jgi:hypothetical protein